MNGQSRRNPSLGKSAREARLEQQEDFSRVQVFDLLCGDAAFAKRSATSS
jgi:hypothetical protein